MLLNRVVGVLLVLIGFIGFLTVADDLRHTGEFIGVLSIMISGLILFAGSTQRFRSLPVRPMTTGILLGLLLGAVFDQVGVGVIIGWVAGAVIGWRLLRKKYLWKGED